MNNLTIKQAERLTGELLDRRRKYFSVDNEVFMHGKCVQPCSGCCEQGENGSMESLYKWDDKNKIPLGSGCFECGYSGKRILHFPIPYNYSQILKSI